jgi:hypothetical protein
MRRRGLYIGAQRENGDVTEGSGDDMRDQSTLSPCVWYTSLSSILISDCCSLGSCFCTFNLYCFREHGEKCVLSTFYMELEKGTLSSKDPEQF